MPAPRSENKMGVMPVHKLLISIALPMIISMLVQAMYNIVDSIYVAQIDAESCATTAISISFPIQNLMIAVGAGTGVGINALLSRSLGEGNREEAGRAAVNGVFLAFLSFVGFLLLGLFVVPHFVPLLTDNPQVASYAVEYLQPVCCLSFGIFGQFAFERLLQSTGKTFYSMITQATGAVINILLDPLFIFGGMGIPAMGMRGAAIATVFGQVVAMIMAILFNRYKNKEIPLSFRHFRPNGRTIRKIYAVGIPSIIMGSIATVMTVFLNLILLTFGEALGKAGEAAFGIYFKLNSFVFMPIFGLNNGVIPIIAYNYGARNRNRMLQAIKLACIYAASVMTVGLLIFEIFPAQLLSIFNASPDLLAIGVPALRIIATPFTVAGICIALGSSFQALGYGIYSMYTSFSRQLVVLIPSAWILARLGQQMGNDSLVWYSYPIAEVASLIVTLFLFSRLYRNVIMTIPGSAGDR